MFFFLFYRFYSCSYILIGLSCVGDKMPVQRSMHDFFRDSSDTSPSRVLVLIHHPPAGEGTDTRTLSVESLRDVMGGGKCEQVQSGCC